MMNGTNTSQRNMQQLINNAGKGATSVMIVTISGDTLSVNGVVELGTEAMAFQSQTGNTVIVPYSAMAQVRIG